MPAIGPGGTSTVKGVRQARVMALARSLDGIVATAPVDALRAGAD
jgi:hypothetical protein